MTHSGAPPTRIHACYWSPSLIARPIAGSLHLCEDWKEGVTARETGARKVALLRYALHCCTTQCLWSTSFRCWAQDLRSNVNTTPFFLTPDLGKCVLSRTVCRNLYYSPFLVGGPCTIAITMFCRFLCSFCSEALATEFREPLLRHGTHIRVVGCSDNHGSTVTESWTSLPLLLTRSNQ